MNFGEIVPTYIRALSKHIKVIQLSFFIIPVKQIKLKLYPCKMITLGGNILAGLEKAEKQFFQKRSEKEATSRM